MKLIRGVFFLINSTMHFCFAEFYNLTEKIASNGYPVERHDVQTEDGYILGLYRIPYGRRSRTRRVNRYPIILMHGLLSCSEGFIISGPDKGLGYVLADSGYDVWLGNARGNYHSRRHIRLDPERDKQFWMFSWNEIGVYDLPAMIDYILKLTNNKRLHYLGHSQGSTSFVVMGSERPEYNEKIKVMIAFSLPLFFSRTPDNIHNILAPFYPILQVIADALGIYESNSLVSPEITSYISRRFCRPNSKTAVLCKEIMSIATGFNDDQLDLSIVPLIYATHPAGGSIRQIFHYFQVMATGVFKKFDWGPRENLRRYGSRIPPEYNIKNVVAPVALFYAENDIFTKKSALPLTKALPNVVELYKVPYKDWSHVDFLWGRDVDTLLHKRALEVIRKYNDV